MKLRCQRNWMLFTSVALKNASIFALMIFSLFVMMLNQVGSENVDFLCFGSDNYLPGK